jgi:hypothetical protein
MTIGIAVNAAFFLCMGLGALVSPRWVTSFVQWAPETVDARNEVRAVYGGFGVAISALLVYAAYHPDVRSGIILAVAIALLGMASGRILSVLIERPGRWPLVFILMESALAGLLLWGA